LIIVADPQRTDADLAAGRVACPHCAGRLQAWAYARVRRVRTLEGETLVVRPRRARCQACARTQVLLPGACLPRRADSTEVVGTALLAKASGRGHRRIAADLKRSPSTVRRWLRAARGRHALGLWHRAVSVLMRLDRETFEQLHRSWVRRLPGDLGEALLTLDAAVGAARSRFPDLTVPAWSLIGALTAGRLLGAAPGG